MIISEEGYKLLHAFDMATTEYGHITGWGLPDETIKESLNKYQDTYNALISYIVGLENK